jgi:hypothetical protein
MSQAQQSVIDRARSRTAKTGDGSSPKKKRTAAKPASRGEAASKAGFRKSDLPEHYADDKKINQRQADFEAKGPIVTVTRDAWEGTIDQLLDDDNAPDPNKEAVDAIRQPGKAYRILSPRVMNRRGRRGWELERDKDGKPIEVPGNGQLIGSRPIDDAIARNKKFQQVSIDAVAQANEQYNEVADELEHASKGTVSILRRGEVVTDNDPRKGGPGAAAVIGAESFRG